MEEHEVFGSCLHDTRIVLRWLQPLRLRLASTAIETFQARLGLIAKQSCMILNRVYGSRALHRLDWLAHRASLRPTKLGVLKR